MRNISYKNENKIGTFDHRILLCIDHDTLVVLNKIAHYKQLPTGAVVRTLLVEKLREEGLLEKKLLSD